MKVYNTGFLVFALCTLANYTMITSPNPNSETPMQGAVPAAQKPIEEPYSIFDRRQKALIVLVVSTAATCE